MLLGEQVEFNPAAHKVYDVREKITDKNGVFFIGGFMGELLITFTCLLDYILANPQNQNFQFSHLELEAYLVDLLVNENFQDDALVIHLTRDPALIGVQPTIDENGNEKFERKKMHEDVFSKFARDRSNITDYGLKFFFEVCKDLVINQEIVDAWYKVIISISQTEARQIHEVPVIPE